MSLRVLAIDPGERAGWATGVISDPIGTIIEPKSHVGHQMREGERYPDGLMDNQVTLSWSPRTLKVTDHGIAFLKDMSLAAYRAIVVEKKYDVVIVEKYMVSGDPQKLKSHIGSEVPTVQLIGAIRLCCWAALEAGANVRYVGQSTKAKSDALLSLKNPGGEEILAKLAKLPKKHDDAHDGDALLHLWSFFFKEFV